MPYKRSYCIYEYPAHLQMKDAIMTGKCKLIMRVETKQKADDQIYRINRNGIMKAFYIYG